MHATDDAIEKHVTLTRQAIDNIEKEGRRYAGIEFEHRANCTILQLSDVKFVICYNYAQYMQKYVAAEHISQHYLL